MNGGEKTAVPILRVKAVPARVPLLMSDLNGLVWGGQNTFLCSPRVMCRDLTLSLSFLIPMSESPIMIVCFNTEKYTSKSMHERNVMAVRKLASVLLTKTSCQTAPVHLNNLHSCISLYFSIVSLICCCHLDISRH